MAALTSYFHLPLCLTISIITMFSREEILLYDRIKAGEKEKSSLTTSVNHYQQGINKLEIQIADLNQTIKGLRSTIHTLEHTLDHERKDYLYKEADLQSSLALKQHEIDEKIQKLKEEEEAHRKRLDENEEIISLRKKYDGLVHELDRMVAAGDFNGQGARPEVLRSASESFDDFKKRKVVERELREARRDRRRHNKDTKKTGRQSNSSLESVSITNSSSKEIERDGYGTHVTKGDPMAVPSFDEGSDEESIEEEEEGTESRTY